MKLNPKNNPFYNRKDSGGYNPCIYGNYPHGAEHPTGIEGANVLPNCTGFCTARFSELAGLDSCKYLGDTDAKNYVALAKSQGLEVGAEPVEGSCICWTNNKHGHVAIVEQVLSDTAIIISESGWNSTKGFWSAVHTKGDGNWTDGEAWMSGYKLLGFIYPPGEEMSYEKFKEYMKQYLAEMAELPVSSWAKEAMDQAAADGILTGNGDGNLRPQSFLTRQEYAAIRSKEQVKKLSV